MSTASVTTIALRFSTTTAPDLGGLRFYVEPGRPFDADAYADAYRLNRHDLDPASVHAAQDAAGRLVPGERLEVTHEVEHVRHERMVTFPHRGRGSGMTDWLTAIHEVGHALVAEELGVQFGTLSIVPKDETEGSCAVEGDDCYTVNPDHTAEQDEAAFREWAETQAVIDFAGHAAIVALLGTGDMTLRSAVEHGANSDFQKAARRLAGDQQRIESAQSRAIALVRARESDIRRLAEVLAARGTMHADDLDRVLAGWPLASVE